MHGISPIGVAFSMLFSFAMPLFADDISPDDRNFFETKIRPVLAENCYRCHGAERQKAKLRLDSREFLLKGGETGPAVIPGDVAKSLLARAISYEHAEFRMPPRGKLPNDEIANLRTWIQRGAFWPDDKAVQAAKSPEFDLEERRKHWSLQPLTQPKVPEVVAKDWPRSAIDRFILAKLEAAGLAPNAPADARTLLRRLHYDLIGLPPTRQEIAAFETRIAELRTGTGQPPDVNAPIPQAAIEEVVDRLLASPHYGERWARHWLDLVRYAETRGHEFDFEIPEAHLYRDYVIRALNADVPYDQFVIEHVAGDLLPEPRRHPEQGFNESILGTGFFFLGEGKHSPVDVRSDQADRRDNQIDVLTKTFLGLTVACARCHDHKFDAISTEDYYGLAGVLESSRFQRAFFDDPRPCQRKLAELQTAQQRFNDAAIPTMVEQLRPQLDRLAQRFPVGRIYGKTDWLLLGEGKPFTSAADFASKRMAFVNRLRDQTTANKEALDFAGGPGHEFRDWIRTGCAAENPANLPLLIDDKSSVVRGVTTPLHANTGLVANRLEGMLQSPTFTISTKQIHYLTAGRNAKINLIIDGFQIIRNPIFGGLSITVNHGESLRWASMNVGMWQGHRAYIEVLDEGAGFAALERVVFSNAAPPLAPANSLLMALVADERTSTAEELAVNYRRVFAETLDQLAAGSLWKQPDRAARIEILNWLLESAPPGKLSAEAAKLLAELRRIEAVLPTSRRALAMLDGSGVDEHVFLRGNHKKPGPVVARRFLEVFGGKDHSSSSGSGRLELARRMVDPSKTPIIPRVLVNRLWKHHFGEGIVRSPDDFGVLGQLPTHPELLDYLAGELVKSQWSMKKLHRLMLLSSTYQMSSSETAKADEVDPANRLLHRMPIRRLEAEIIRDALLAVSGRLDRTMYGPSVLPHLTPFMAGRGRPGQSGPLDGNGRRSIYINVRRNFLTPLFLAFDYPTPFSTIGRRSVSNVPAQALTMMNNPLVVQQAELWAKRVLAQPKLSREERVIDMYEAAFARQPSNAEMREALGFVTEQTTAQGREDLAWSDLGHVLFNLKEFIFVP